MKVPLPVGLFVVFDIGGGREMSHTVPSPVESLVPLSCALPLRAFINSSKDWTHRLEVDKQTSQYLVEMVVLWRA